MDQLVTLKITDLKPYEKNARRHEAADINAIAKSIEAFGFNDPVGVWGPNNIIVEGHGRVLAAKQLGMTEIPCVRLDDLTDEERRAYGLAHNKTAELSTWDAELLPLELADLPSYDMTEYGFDAERMANEWFEMRKRMDDGQQEDNDEYNEFLEKFEIKKTTDDCYTPDLVYEAVADWVAQEYCVDRKRMVRPFYPGGDYTKERYKKDAVVVDNPPFSILSEIIKWYADHDIAFFLFAPGLTLFSSAVAEHTTALGCNVAVTYENKATVSTSFLTNLEDAGIRARSAPDLYKAVQEANDRVQAELHREIPKYSYPDEVLTSAMLGKYSKYGIDFRLSVKESQRIGGLDAQKEDGKAIYGSGFLMSERAAAERAAAQRWALSDRERDRAELRSVMILWHINTSSGLQPST